MFCSALVREKAIAITQMFHNSEDKMPIKNRGFFTDVEFFADYNFQLIGECAGKKLLLIGRTKAYGDPIVATSQTDKPSQEDLYASDLYELMKINQEPIKVTGLS